MARHRPPTSILDMTPYCSDDDGDADEGTFEEPLRILTQVAKPKKAKPKVSTSPKQRPEPSNRVAPHHPPTNAPVEKDLELDEVESSSLRSEPLENARSYDNDIGHVIDRPQTAFEPFLIEQDASRMDQEDCFLLPEPKQLLLSTTTEPTPVQGTENDNQSDGGAFASERDPPRDLSQAPRDSEKTVHQEEPRLIESRLEEPKCQEDAPTIDERADDEIASTSAAVLQPEPLCAEDPGPTPVQDEPTFVQASPRRVHAVVKKPIVYYQVPPPASNSSVVDAVTGVDSAPSKPPAPRYQDIVGKPSVMSVAASRNEPELTGSSMLVPPTEAAAAPTMTLLDDLEHYDIEIEKVVKEIEELTLLQRQRQATKPPLVVHDDTSYVQLHQTSQTTLTPRASPKKPGHTSPRRESPRKLAPLPESKDHFDEGEKKPEAPPPSYARPTRSRVSHLDAPPESPRKLRAAVKPPTRNQAPRQRKPALNDDKASEVRKEATTKTDKSLPPLEHKDAARKNPLGVPAHILEDGGVYPWSKLMQQVIVPQGTDSPVVYVPIFNPAYIAELKKASPSKPASTKPSPTKPARHGRRTNVKPH